MWSCNDGAFYRFNTDGTGGIAATTDAVFADDFSFLVWSGTGVTPGYARLNTLAVVSGDTTDPAKALLRLYSYTVSGSVITARETGTTGALLSFTRVSGEPAPLDIKSHALLGRWEARWNGENHSGALGTWSFWYRPDGTVRTYHHGLHQFDNAYLIRGGVLLIIGEWRFHPSLPVNMASLSVQNADAVSARETGGTSWDYVRKENAKWK
jgi:hypothetical protein